MGRGRVVACGVGGAIFVDFPLRIVFAPHTTKSAEVTFKLGWGPEMRDSSAMIENL